LNLAVAFSGWVDPATAVSNSASIKNSLPGTKYIGLGGGNSNGAWTSALVQSVASACNSGTFSGYNGIAFDIEVGDSGLSSAFSSTFSTCKSKGFQILVTISHSAPYGIGDAGTLMSSFLSNSNIDIISPQLYTTGNEGSNDYTTSGGVGWAQYAGSRAKIVPSIVTGTLYNDAATQFGNYGVSIAGFIQWSQTVSIPANSGSAPVAAARPTSSKAAPVASSNGCPAGQCKSQWGYCGTGPSYCGGSSPVAAPKAAPVSNGCPAGECKSKWGYCGTGPSYCDGGSRLDDSTQTDSPHVGALPTGVFVAVVVCSVAAVVFIVGIAIFLVMRKQNKEETI